ncbi:MATE family efflux transporter [Lutispora saccharofermentans]|uniref:Probable multidrug resistance protein NorM n=1 Tax=Lutispora saccharofermentans TaxID=3024236 RepID=A0ABT1NFL1_9FIRM|nr:MATE family efflux transporter [Lutispora saccharofermentans]MCQ1530032.1 MATE family efflux transporter [Lutispora saccharofermentans]
MLQVFSKDHKSHPDYGKMRRKAISITWPAFIELVMTSLFGMVDMIMVGQLSPAAIASVGLTNQPFFLLLAVFAAVNVGTSTLVAWNIGAKKPDEACNVTRQVLILNTLLGIFVTVIGIYFAPNIVTFMGANSDTFRDATLYFKIVAAGLAFQAVNMGVTAALRGAGQTKLPMLYNAGSNLLNVFGNYVLIFGKFGFPEWGVAGAAVSTTAARLIACLAGLYLIFFTKQSSISLSIKGDYRINTGIVRQIFSIGIPAALEQFVLQSGLMVFARTVSSLGTSGFAAHQIGINISTLTFSPSQAFGVAATTLVGQSLGAGDEGKAKEFADMIHHMAVLVALFMGVVFLLFSHQLAGLYTEDLAVAAMAGTVLKILALAQPGQSTQLAISGALRGAGDTLYPLYACIFGIWIFRVFTAYIFVSIFHWGLIGAWIALVLDQSARALIVYLRYRSGKWKYVKAKINKVEEAEAY